MEGLRHTEAVVPFADRRSPGTSVVVQRLVAAGAFVLGKANQPDFQIRWNTVNALYPPTRNPRDPSLSAGGSSGGDAAAVAAGMAALGLGADYGGSIRVPACFCGVYGVRPSAGRVPHVQTLDAAAGGMTHDLMNSPGPLARSLDDLWTALGVLAGADARDPSACRSGSRTTRRARVAADERRDGCGDRAGDRARARPRLRGAGRRRLHRGHGRHPARAPRTRALGGADRAGAAALRAAGVGRRAQREQPPAHRGDVRALRPRRQPVGLGACVRGAPCRRAGDGRVHGGASARRGAGRRHARAAARLRPLPLGRRDARPLRPHARRRLGQSAQLALGGAPERDPDRRAPLPRGRGVRRGCARAVRRRGGGAAGQRESLA